MCLQKHSVFTILAFWSWSWYSVHGGHGHGWKWIFLAGLVSCKFLLYLLINWHFPWCRITAGADKYTSERTTSYDLWGPRPKWHTLEPKIEWADFKKYKTIKSKMAWLLSVGCITCELQYRRNRLPKKCHSLFRTLGTLIYCSSKLGTAAIMASLLRVKMNNLMYLKFASQNLNCRVEKKPSHLFSNVSGTSSRKLLPSVSVDRVNKLKTLHLTPLSHPLRFWTKFDSKIYYYVIKMYKQDSP